MQRSHLQPEHGARIQYSVGTNVNTSSFQVPTLEFGHGAGAREKSLIWSAALHAHLPLP